MRGRINNAPLPDDAKFPYLLPKKNRLTSLLISDIHIHNQHCGIGSYSHLSETKPLDSVSETRSSMRYSEMR